MPQVKAQERNLAFIGEHTVVILRSVLLKVYVTGKRFHDLKKAINGGSISQMTYKCICLLAFVLTLAHSGSNLIAFLVMNEESPILAKGVEICLHGAVKHVENYEFVLGAAPLLISCALFLIHDIMTVRLLRTNATDNLEIQRRRFIVLLII